MAKRKIKYPAKHGCGMIIIGIGFLIAALMIYLGYGWMEIFAVLGVLAIIKGIWKMKK